MIYYFQHTIAMGYFRKKLERRTYSQDRYYILIKRQKEGTASLNDLTELDEIINRLPDIREKVLRENFYEEEHEDQSIPPANPTTDHLLSPKRKNLPEIIRSFFHRLFTVHEADNNIISLL
ncbi:MAG: hypothetical protein JST19_08780 [Bacteroidetes bacterium]|nr:hypothetical protein [Bacteroidota bacterium]